MNAIDRIKKLDEERAKLLDEAKKEALDKAKAAIAELNELGFAYKLVAGEGATSGKKSRNTDPNKPCAICKFATEPNHDGRQHRNQKPKRAFNAEELKELGMKRKAA